MFFSVAVGSWAAKAIPMPVKVTQPDGTVLTVMLYGDEHFHYYTTTDGALLYPNDDAFYIAHVESDYKVTTFDVKVELLEDKGNASASDEDESSQSEGGFVNPFQNGGYNSNYGYGNGQSGGSFFGNSN